MCELRFSAGASFWLGALLLDYTVTAVLFVVPLLLLGAHGIVPLALATDLAVAVGGVVIPVLLYRASWSWWLMLYFFFLPQELPSNGEGLAFDELA